MRMSSHFAADLRGGDIYLLRPAKSTTNPGITGIQLTDTSPKIRTPLRPSGCFYQYTAVTHQDPSGQLVIMSKRGGRRLNRPIEQVPTKLGSRL